MAHDQQRRAALERSAHALTELVWEAANQADPVGLIEDEAPPDEYRPEIDRIVGRIVRLGMKPTDQQVTQICESVFREYFGNDTTMMDGAHHNVATYHWSVGRIGTASAVRRLRTVAHTIHKVVPRAPRFSRQRGGQCETRSDDA